jgi:protein pelota
VAQYGTEEYVSFTRPTGKGEYARPRTELFDEVGSALSHLDVDAVVLAGPGFTKNDARDYIADEYREAAEKIVKTVDTSGVGDRGVHEVLKRGAIDDVQKETRIAEESRLIDDLMDGMATGEKVAYGIDEVAEAADFGAVDELLVLDARLRDERQGAGDWDVDVNDVIESVEQKGGSVTVFSDEFAPGQQLKNLGGIAALLRYRLQ